MGKRSTSFLNDNSFYWFANNVTATIKANKDGTLQKEQVENLMKLERRFKRSLQGSKILTEVYRTFVQMIVVKNRNILDARPYFREKSNNFSAKITPAIRDAKISELKKFDINFLFIKFIRDNWIGKFPEDAQKCYDDVVQARRRLIEDNIPLAINRAKLFYGKVPNGPLGLMDMIGIAITGLISGIDKYCGAYTPVFRSVCIGRMGGNMIDSYSDTMIHFYPSDRHVLYRANQLTSREGLDSYESLAKAINKSFENDKTLGRKGTTKPVTASELASLMKAASTLSATVPFDPETSTATTLFDIQDLSPEEDEEEEDKIANREALSKVLTVAQSLPLIQQKILRLKGVKL